MTTVTIYSSQKHMTPSEFMEVLSDWYKRLNPDDVKNMNDEEFQDSQAMGLHFILN